MKRTVLLIMLILTLVVPVGWFVQRATYARQNPFQPLTSAGRWNTHNYDLIYTVAFSSQQQPNGPLVVYRALGADLRTNVPVVALARTAQAQTPLFFPSPNGQYVALLSPLQGSYDTDLNGASLSIFSTDGKSRTMLVPTGVAAGDQIIWSTDGQSLYYHSGIEQFSYNTRLTKANAASRPTSPQAMRQTVQPASYSSSMVGYDEIHRVDLHGHDSVLLRHTLDDSSMRLIGLDNTGALIATLARPQQPVALIRVQVNAMQRMSHNLFSGGNIIATLPPDILPGNVLRIGSDGASVECERVLSWQPLRYSIVRISFANRTPGRVSGVDPLFSASSFGRNVTALSRSVDGRVLVMSQVVSVRSDLAAQGIAGVPSQEALVLADAHSGARQNLQLPPGGQIVQTFWTAHIPATQVHIIPSRVLAGLLAFHKRLSGNSGRNATVFQQDEWMLEGHAGKLFDAPAFSSMCYGTCSQGARGAPHVSAAILHGTAYVETNWHQFNTSDYQVNGEPVGSPVKSWDGGWGEFQQTWGMPPQCTSSGNCRIDAAKIQQEQSYNIGTGIQSLISAWNGTAGVASSTDPNDPYKANDWFFAVWAYNGAYGNNPNDVASSVYAHWYPGAPFRSIYEEYVWYFAAHPQYASNGWTDNYLPSLGPSLLPPQADFVNTSDSFVACVSCTIPDWTSGSFDRDWVGVGAPNAATAGYFKTLYTQLGGEDIVGLPRDNTGGAAVHRWAAGWIQDFGGGAYLPGAFMMIAGTTTPYWVYGGVWTQYVTVDSAATGCHGYPTSALVLYANPGLGPDSYYRQSFQRGTIVWDATTHMITADSCS